MSLTLSFARFAFLTTAFALGAFTIYAQPEPEASPAATPAPAARPARRPLPEPANPKLPSVFLIGDSTVRNGSDDGQGKGAEGQWGWGHPIADYFDLNKVNLVNRAVGGTSSRTYLIANSGKALSPS